MFADQDNILHTRYIYTLGVWLRVPPPTTAQWVVDPWTPDRGRRIVTLGKTWWTLEAGDRVECVKEGKWVEYEVESIELLRAFPCRYNGLTVKNAMQWMTYRDDGYRTS